MVMKNFPVYCLHSWVISTCEFRLCLVPVKCFLENKYFQEMLFSYKFFTFTRLFSQHPNKFYYRKFQNHNQIPIHTTNQSQIPTPHTTKTPIQPMVANSGNQKPQPPKHHYHTTTTTTKIKITERDWWVEDRWVEGEIAQRRDRRRDRAAQCDWRCAAVGAVRSMRCD